MRRAARLVTKALPVPALALCVAAVALWVRSYSVADHLGYGRSHYDGARQFLTQSTWSARSAAGRLALSVDVTTYHTSWPYAAVADRPFRRGRYYDRVQRSGAGPTPPSTAWHGFRLDRHVRPPAVPLWGRAVEWTLGCPHAFLAAAATIPPLGWLRRIGRRRRRAARGLCSACGYDLRATPEKGGALLDRCPECGTVPSKHVASA